MFSTQHFIWLGICFILITTALCYLKKRRPSLESVLSKACIVCVLSELVKTLSVLEVVPSGDGSTMHLYFELNHLPLHLCSIQILFIFYTRFSQNARARETLLAFMYPTCTLGAAFAMSLPTIFSSSVKASQAFTHPLAYQFFLYHAMLLVLGLYIAISGEVNIRPHHYLSSMGILSVLAFASLYLNVMFASPTYINGELVSVDYSTNFFFTQKLPIDIALTEKWHWFAWWGLIVFLAAGLLWLFYLPFISKERKRKQL